VIASEPPWSAGAQGSGRVPAVEAAPRGLTNRWMTMGPSGLRSVALSAAASASTPTMLPPPLARFAIA